MTDCPDCPIATANRRRFLRDVGLAVGAALLAGGLSPSSALASLVAEIRPVKRSGARVTYALPKSDAVLVDSDNDLIIARAGRSVYAFSIKCPHKRARLEWREDESKIFCPKHKARFDPRGEHVSGRRSRNLDRYRIQLESGAIVADTSMLFREDQNPGQWQSAAIIL